MKERARQLLARSKEWETAKTVGLVILYLVAMVVLIGAIFFLFPMVLESKIKI